MTELLVPKSEWVLKIGGGGLSNVVDNVRHLWFLKVLVHILSDVVGPVVQVTLSNFEF